ncbi:MAG TPA: hypothetical protein VN241_02530 [Microbacterium sp.]|nr:hypothetical protein [Microbacterium sp.]
MSNTPTPPIVPFPDGEGSEEVPTTELDGDEVLDPDFDDDQIDSATADRVATTETYDENDEL